MDHKDLKSSGFWVGQLFMLAGTVLGVYMAAQAGLYQALQYDAIIDMQNNYYLRLSLHDELHDNVQTLRSYTEQLAHPGGTDLRQLHPELGLMVWESMKFSAVTLETPSQFLSESQRFYQQVADLVSRVESRVIGASFAIKRINELCDVMEQKTLPALEESYQALRADLEQRGAGL
ncbi:MAG: hypothetical protein H6999_12440 [Hahellaceae bacterium]|nr:hypothetical protein [Hahellaceae bacterium]